MGTLQNRNLETGHRNLYFWEEEESSLEQEEVLIVKVESDRPDM